MKQKLLYLLPLFLLSGCGQATYKNASLPAEERAGGGAPGQFFSFRRSV